MVDNVAITAGSGTTVATDDVGGFHYQRVKVVWGADGSVNDTSAAAPIPTVDSALATAVNNAASAATVLSVTPTLDTLIYADADLLFDTTSVASFMASADGTATVMSVTVIDINDQGVGFDLYFLNAATSMGTINSAPNMSAANIASTVIGRVSFSSADFTDLGLARVAVRSGLGIVLKATGGVSTIYVAAVTKGGTPTYTASGLVLKIGVVQD